MSQKYWLLTNLWYYASKKVIANPIPNITANAEWDLEKFKGYIFSDKYAWNGKRDLFEKLGFSINDSEYLTGIWKSGS